MPAAFMASSVVVVPSTEPEAFGRVAVEAQAMGAPVVLSLIHISSTVPRGLLIAVDATCWDKEYIE